MEIETVTYGGGKLATIVRGGSDIEGKEFVSSNEDYLQVGFMNLKDGEKITPHVHKINRRDIEKTHEVIYVVSGKMKVNFYKDKKKVDEKILVGGDLIILMEGGHGFEFFGDTKIFEVKQGPYSGYDKDKEAFEVVE